MRIVYKKRPDADGGILGWDQITVIQIHDDAIWTVCKEGHRSQLVRKDPEEFLEDVANYYDIIQVGGDK
jgi:hypothetical protein